ncbi:MAG: hypothetical protein JNM60_08985 [Candidatus Competibacteraceae bacterium]|nr:hypothetical protein [Candidatus Competibacteraceae bacterium]
MRLPAMLTAALAAVAPALAATDERERFIAVQASGPQGGAPAAGQPMDVRISIRDPATGAPLTGARPALWLAPIGAPEAESTRCEIWVSRLLNAPVAPAGVIDLNGFDVIQATDDGRLALVDPQLNLASANIKAIVSLAETPVAWAIEAEGRELWVALAKTRTIAKLTLDPFAVATKHQLASAPSALAALGAAFWVGTADGEVLRLERESSPALAGRVGQGRVLLDSAGQEGLFALAENGDGSFIDGLGLAGRFRVGVPVRAAAFAPLADTLYALDRSGRQLLAVARDSPERPVSLALARPASSLTSSPDGRWLALTADSGQSVTVYDTTANRERWTIEFTDPVIGAMFSDAFLYLMHRQQGGVSRVVFDPEGGPPGITTIAAGTSGAIPQQASRLPLAVRVPKAGIFLASARDRAAYRVSEEGMAPMSSLPLRAGTPAGILLRYRGAVPDVEEGDYTARAIPRHGGPYLAVVRTEQPNKVHCARLDIGGPPDPAVAGQSTAAVAPPATLQVEPIRRRDQQVRFSLSGPHSGALAIHRAVLMASDGNWRRLLNEVRRADDLYIAPVALDYDGPLQLYVEFLDQGGALRTVGAPVVRQEGAQR